MQTTRRDFLRTALGASTGLALSPAVPGLLSRRAVAAAVPLEGRNSVLVVLQLSGGNDGLNTVVPYEDDAYHRNRPTLRLRADRVHKLDSALGLHPEMAAFLRLYREGHLAIIQGVGYPNSKRDHEAAMSDWHTARPQETLTQTGWIGRAIDRACLAGETDVPGVFVGPIPPPFGLQTEQAVVPAIKSLDDWLPAKAWPVPPMLGPAGSGASSWAGVPPASGPGLPPATRASRPRTVPFTAPVRGGESLEAFPAGASNPLPDFLRRTALAAAAVKARLEAVRQAAAATGAAEYPGFPLAQTLKSVAQLIRAELGIRVYFAELGGGGIGGFDTHADQAANHGALLRELSESVAAFLGDLRRDRWLDSVWLMTFSEFGRTLSENGRRGTGHGAAAPVFLAGGRLKGGLVGPHPSLSDLDADAPKFHTDFRRVYATVLDRWLGFDSQAVLGEKFAPLEGVLA